MSASCRRSPAARACAERPLERLLARARTGPPTGRARGRRGTSRARAPGARCDRSRQPPRGSAARSRPARGHAPSRRVDRCGAAARRARSVRRASTISSPPFGAAIASDSTCSASASWPASVRTRPSSGISSSRRGSCFGEQRGRSLEQAARGVQVAAAERAPPGARERLEGTRRQAPPPRRRPAAARAAARAPARDGGRGSRRARAALGHAARPSRRSARGARPRSRFGIES